MNHRGTTTRSIETRGLGRLLTLALILTVAALAVVPAAEARTTRAYEGSFGGGSLGAGLSASPSALAVDQANGDVYAFGVDGLVNRRIARFDSSGAPKNFTAGPGAGTNTLTGNWSHIASIAIDNSGGPLDGTVYVQRGGVGPSAVEAFSRSGASLGEIDGTGTGEVFGSTSHNACSIAVDQSDGSLYIGQQTVGTWRYAPAAPAGAIDDADYAITGIEGAGCSTLGGGVAADSGSVYVFAGNNSPLERYSAADFAIPAAEAAGTEIVESGVAALAVDPGNGDLYANRDGYVSVFDSAGQSLYEFGARAYFGAGLGTGGSASQGIAVEAEGPGPAAKAYVADRSTEHEIDVFGGLTKVPTYTHFELGAFGPDGTTATQFGPSISSTVDVLAFANAAQSLYALDESAPGIYGFEASSPPPPFAPLGAFSPLGTAAPGFPAGLAVDNTALGSAGNVYLASQSTDLLYGWDDSGTPLAGFPVDPATAPGAPDGSPKDLCGATVDSAGNVWVANRSAEKVLKYSSAGAYLGAVDTSAQGGGPCQLALDSADNLYADIGGSGAWKYNAASGYTSATHVVGGAPGSGGQTHSFAVDPANDHLFVADRAYDMVDEYDPAGNLVDEFAVGIRSKGVALDPVSGDTYIADRFARQIRAFGPSLILPEVTARPVAAPTNSTATLSGEVVSQEVALTECRFEHVSLAAFRVSGFEDLSSGGEAPCDPAFGSIPLDLEEHPVSAAIAGLDTDTPYRFRLVAENAEGETASAVEAFQTTGPALAETTGTPLREATKARLMGRVYPARADAGYHFEYGDQGPCDANPCTSTPVDSVPASNATALVAAQVAGLDPGATYHYRLIADNGNADGPQAGEDATVTTRAAPERQLGHGDFPGPPGSDRAWELVSVADSSANPVLSAEGFSEDGNRAVYSLVGGTSESATGGYSGLYGSVREQPAPHRGGWRSQQASPDRPQLAGSNWSSLRGREDLSSFVATNWAFGYQLHRQISFWRLSPDGDAEKLFQPVDPQAVIDGGGSINVLAAASQGETVIVRLSGGTIDPAHPSAGALHNLYDISQSPPELVSLLPGNVVGPCDYGGASDDVSSAKRLGRESISADGSLVVFLSPGASCGSADRLYLRDLVAEETTLLSPPALSGDDCEPRLIKTLPDSVIFRSASRLLAADAVPDTCNTPASNDLYRYELASGEIQCLTCFEAGLASAVGRTIVAEDGSRLYFSTSTRLLSGAQIDGQNGLYRLELESGDLAYVGPSALPTDPQISADGSKLVLDASSSLDPLGDGLDSGGASQAFLYDDTDRSLTCITCPLDGSTPQHGPQSGIGAASNAPNTSRLAEDGTYAFDTAESLLDVDQNTPPAGSDPQKGVDVYEWRDGRHLLVTDGVTSWRGSAGGVSDAPLVRAISPSGDNVFFTAWDRLTPAATDSYQRLYVARVGGGFEFPPPGLPPCDLNSGACEGGRATVDPEVLGAGSAVFEGPGDLAEPLPVNCSAAARRAQKLGRAARKLRRAAGRAANPKRARALRRKAGRRSRAAKKRRVAAKRCRRANRNRGVAR